MPTTTFTAFPGLRIPQRSDMDKTWDVILGFVNHALKRPFERLSMEDSINFYTVVYNYCTSASLHNVTRDGRSGASLAGFQLFSNLRKTIEDHVRIIMTHTDNLHDDELLHCYMHEWKRYSTTIQRLQHPFSHLDKCWIQPERIRDRTQEIYAINKFLLVTWGRIFVQHIQEDDQRLSKALIRLTLLDRNKKLINMELLQNVLETLVSVGLTSYDPDLEWLEIYESVFEKPFIETTEQHYDQKSITFLSESNIYDYLREAENWLKEEEIRINRYIHPKTQTILMLKCRKILFYRFGYLIRETYLGLPEPEGCTWEDDERAKQKWRDRQGMERTKECNMDDAEKFRFLYALLSRIPGCDKYMVPEEEADMEEPEYDFITEDEGEEENELEGDEEGEGEDEGTERGEGEGNEEKEGEVKEVKENEQREENEPKGGGESKQFRQEEGKVGEETQGVHGTEQKEQDKYKESKQKENGRKVKEEERNEPTGNDT